MNEWLSNKFKWLSFFATWAVVVLHSGVCAGGNARIDVLREVVGKYVTWAVPLFFIISGYLFCISYEKYGWRRFFAKKIKTLYVPVVAWCFLSEILVLPTTLYSHDMPGIRACLGSFLLLINVDAWAPFTSLHSVSQLWYVRDLIFWFALAPILYFIGKWKWWSILAALLGAYGLMKFGVFWVWRYEFRFVWLGLFFLVCGMVLYHSGLALKRLDKKVAACIFPCAIVLSILTGDNLFHRIFLVLAVWTAYDLLDELGWCGTCPPFAVGVFFVYCIHEVVLRYIKGISIEILGKGDLVRLMVYLLHIGSFWLDLGIAIVVRRCCPRLYLILSGSR